MQVFGEAVLPLPKRATDLIDQAETHGWEVLVQWQKDTEENPFVTIKVGRVVTASERPALEAKGWIGDYWSYQMTWHSRFAREGKLIMFGKVLGETPQRPTSYECTLRDTVATIVANPHPDHSTHRWT